jgi:predicted nucleotidyltransferase
MEPGGGSMSALPIAVPAAFIAEFCPRNYIRKLSFFGSVLTPRFRPDSDIDVLVEFDPDHTPGLLGVARMERELSERFGRKVDLRTAEDLSRYFREEVVASAVLQYESR